ncbi:MAG TPA: hypothetical protein VMW05_09030 [Methyloceanibacter sp.]|nr:hypothetical protein [Methyloceanibacter sp.]
MAGTHGRFEFRCWARDLSEVERSIRQNSEPSGTEDSEEIYVVAPGCDGSNVKLREGTIDIKVLVATRDGLEQWQPRSKHGLPVKAETIAQEVLPALGVTAALEMPEYAREGLLEQVVQPHQDLKAVPVTKQRRFFTVNGCMTELADVVIDGEVFQTAALEAEKPEVVIETKRRLGLDKFENVSYVRAVKHVIGMKRCAAMP